MDESPGPRLSPEANFKPLDPDYFDLQLKFADVVSAKYGVDLPRAVFTHTNFFMRLSFGARRDLAEDLPAWQAFVGELALARDKTAFVYQAYLNAPPGPPSGATPFGCFSIDPVGEDGVVRFHFANKEHGEVGPLSASRVTKRWLELRALFAHIRESYPQARTVNGNSWLYHFEAYRRLFPSAYGDSRIVVRHSSLIQGTSRWGQFLDRRGRVVPDVKATFLANLAGIDAEHLCDAFPIPTYRTAAPVKEFYQFLNV
jgi:hypothetical protein